MLELHVPVEIAVQGFALEMILGVGGRSLALGISSFGVSGFGGALTMAFPKLLLQGTARHRIAA